MKLFPLQSLMAVVMMVAVVVCLRTCPSDEALLEYTNKFTNDPTLRQKRWPSKKELLQEVARYSMQGLYAETPQGNMEDKKFYLEVTKQEEYYVAHIVECLEKLLKEKDNAKTKAALFKRISS